MDEEGNAPTPRSGRIKKKSALARLAAKRGQQKTSDEADEDSSKPTHYPIDAKVEIHEHGQKEEDSDEGIEMASGSYDAAKRRVSTTALDGLKDLNMENENSSNKGAKRLFDQDSSSNDEANSASRKVSKQPSNLSHMSDDDSDDGDTNTSNNLSEIRREYKERYKDLDSPSPMSGSREDVRQMYKEHLHNNSQESIDDESSEREDTMGPFPRPGSSKRGPLKHGSSGSSMLFQNSILNSLDLENQWSGIGNSGTIDAASQISSTSSSVLPLISTKAAKSRSYLYGTINSSSALMGGEELDRYFPERKVRVFVGSWNMCEMKDVPENIDEFLLPDSAEHVQDIYVIGTQESTSNRQEWEIKIQETLGPQHVLFHSAVHGTLGLIIFMRRDLIWFCSVSEEGNVTTRPGANIKTKGAVAVCFTFFGTSFLFINSHFTAHDDKTQERIADYHKIVKTLTLPKIVQGNRYHNSKPEPESKKVRKKGDVTTRFDRVFWCGDLNFRIESDRDHVNTLVASIIDQEFPDYDGLLGHDQLTKAILQGLIFHEFQEGKISFKPTYKFDKGTDTYDTKKLRIPSYTDRVLFRSLQKNATTCLFYDSVMEQKESDHKPVYGLFEVNIRSGRDNIPLGGGQFNRDVWLEGCGRRAQRKVKSKEQKASTICSIQ